MTTVFLKVISDILRQHEELLRKYKQKALKLKEYDGIFLNARTTGGRTYFTSHRPGQKPKYIGNEKHTTVQRIQNLRATKVLISMLESNIAALKHFQDNYIDITTEEIRKRLPKSYVPANLREAELSLNTAQKWYQKLLEIKESMPMKYPEKCTVSTIDGTLVRSRIEAIIYDHLVSAGLLVIYEFPIIIEGRIVYPDFLIMHPLTGKLYILEHLGYWYHDAKGAGYRSNFCIKTVELASLGFILGKNILTTFEDGGGTIDTEKIDKMIQREFFTSPTVQEKTTGVNPEEFLKQQMQAQAAARLAG